MGVVSCEMEATYQVPPVKFFKASVVDAVNIYPKILPEIFKNTEFIKGDGEPGTVRKIFFSVGGQEMCMTQRIDGLDEEKLTYTYSIIDGDALMGILESVSSEVKLSPTPDGSGTVYKTVTHYHTKRDAVISQDYIDGNKQQAHSWLKAVEAYLLANPSAY